MSPAADFTVCFGRTARTLVYEDVLGTVCFTFDISPAKDQSTGKWNLHLGNQAFLPDGKRLECQTPAEYERVRLALEKVKEYASSRGYQVELENS